MKYLHGLRLKEIVGDYVFDDLLRVQKLASYSKEAFLAVKNFPQAWYDFFRMPWSDIKNWFLGMKYQLDILRLLTNAKPWHFRKVKYVGLVLEAVQISHRKQVAESEEPVTDMQRQVDKVCSELGAMINRMPREIRRNMSPREVGPLLSELLKNKIQEITIKLLVHHNPNDAVAHLNKLKEQHKKLDRQKALMEGSNGTKDGPKKKKSKYLVGFPRELDASEWDFADEEQDQLRDGAQWFDIKAAFAGTV